MQSRMLVRSVGLCLTLVVCIALLLPPITTQAQTATSAAYLVKDIASTSVPGDVVLKQKLGVLNNVLFFIGVDLLHGQELWRTDGTAAGTSLVKDIAPGPKGAFAPFFNGNGCDIPSAVVNGSLFFIVNRATESYELWKTDGTSDGTVRVRSIDEGPGGDNEDTLDFCGQMWAIKDVLVMGIGTYNDNKLWRSNGTAAGTVELDARESEGIVVNNTLFFFNQYEGSLWRSDGTRAGTTKLKEDIYNPRELTSTGSTLFFKSDDTLWKSDGTAAGTVVVKKITSPTGGAFLQNLTAVNKTVWFIADDGTHGVELWKSDGTTAGTVLIKDINPGATGSDPAILTSIGETVFFSANDGAHGRQLWKSNGTAAGTVAVKDVDPNGAIAIGGTLFFDVSDGSQAGLWKSDGTAAGTQRLLDRPVASLTAAAGKTVFTVGTSSDRVELWSSDGTVGGTIYLSVNNVWIDDQFELPSFTALNGTVVFGVLNDQGVHTLWRSDGTPAGTSALTNGAPHDGGSYPTELTAVGDTLFFVVSLIPTCLPLTPPYSAPEPCAAPGQELWRSDGTNGGTSRLKGLTTISDLVQAQGKLFFLGKDDSGTGLWQSDGTSAGTVEIKHVGNELTSLTSVNGTLFFKKYIGPDDVSAYQLWRSDGTRTGTVPLDYAVPERRGLQPINGTLFFFGFEPVYGDGDYGLWKANSTSVTPVLLNTVFVEELSSVQGQLYFTDPTGALWTSDGTTAGTRRVKRITSAYRTAPAELQSSNGKLLFQANDGSTGTELWRSNGQSSGTVRVKDIRRGSLSSNPSELVSVNGTLFFRANDGASGAELWKSDGTTQGTVLVKDIIPGSSGSYPTGLIKISSALFFNAGDPMSGRELWVSDGTTTGTKQVQDIAPGSASADPAEFTVVGSRVFFNANDGDHGRELWAVPLAAVGLSATASDASE